MDLVHAGTTLILGELVSGTLGGAAEDSPEIFVDVCEKMTYKG